MTQDLIDRLTADLKPVPKRALQRWTLGAVGVGAVIATVIMLPWLGLRADITSAPMTMMFWVKFGYTLLLAIAGAAATITLARPDGYLRWRWLIAVALVAVVFAGGLMQWSMAPPDQAMHLIVGTSSLVCPWYIVTLSLPILALTLAALRRMAPANPTVAGLAAGLLSGGTGAWVYAFHCGENGMLFLALWYTLGIAMVALLGALIGRFLLRW